MTVKISFQTFVDNLPENYIACRADGHGPWRALTARWDRKARVYDRRRRCGNCGTVKPQMLDAQGYILKMQRGGYGYPEGYLATNVDLPSIGEQKATYRLAAVRIEMREPRRKAS
jgi:hypothetical protein